MHVLQSSTCVNGSNLYNFLAEIKYYARRAREADERSQKRRRTSDDDVIKSSYHIATAAFYLQSVCNEKDPAER